MTAAATQIGKVWKGWHSLPRFLSRLWLPLLILFSLTLLCSMFVAVFGYIPLLSPRFHLEIGSSISFLYASGYSILVLLPLTILAGLAHDLEGQDPLK